MDEPAKPPIPSDAEVLQAVLRLVQSGLPIHRRCQDTIDAMGWDYQDVVDCLSECDVSELHKHEPDDCATREMYVAVFHIELEDWPYELYVKLALNLPDLDSGYVLSFKPWT